MVKSVFFLVTLFVSLSISSNLYAQAPSIEIKGGPMHPLCKNCHQVDTNMIRGTLDSVSYKANLLTIDVGTHKEAIKFDDSTLFKNLKGLEDLRNYRGRGFRVHYTEEGGSKKAILITRFDILQSIKQEDRVTRDDIKRIISSKQNVLIIDSRPMPAYEEAHIPGAKALPAPSFEKFQNVLPADKNTPIIFYCVGGCLSPTNYLRTKALGYTNVKVYFGGYPDWMQREYGVTTARWLKKAIDDKLAYVLVDLRPTEEAKKGFIPTAVSIPFERLNQSKEQFPKQTRAPIILYGPNKEKAAEMIISWGYRNVRILEVDFDGWQKLAYPVATGDIGTRISYVPKAKPGTILPDEFVRLVKNPPSNLLVIDVRNPDEYKAGGIRAAKNIPLDELEQRLSEIPRDRDIILHCETGIRAQMAQSILDKHGIKSRYLEARISISKTGEVTVESD